VKLRRENVPCLCRKILATLVIVLFSKEPPTDGISVEAIGGMSNEKVNVRFWSIHLLLNIRRVRFTCPFEPQNHLSDPKMAEGRVFIMRTHLDGAGSLFASQPSKSLTCLVRCKPLLRAHRSHG